MDLKVFADDSFNLKNWVNNVFDSTEAKESKDMKQYASSLVMRLQLAIQEVDGSIEEASTQIVGVVPRVLRDIETLSHEASILKNQMNNVKNDIERVEKNTAASMHTLIDLDAVKERLAASSQALKEADNWTTLSSDAEEVMDSCNVDQISSKLISLQNCLSILTHVPDYEERVAYLEGLKVRLEAILSPHLVTAFSKHNIGDSLKYAKMLNTLGRSQNLESYYLKYETQQLLVTWQAGVESHPMSNRPLWLSTFYEHLSAFITKQVKWCEVVFPTSNSVLLIAQLTHSALTHLDPSISQVVSVAVKQQDEPIPFLVTVKKTGEDFLEDYIKICSFSTELQEVNRGVMEAVYDPLKNQMDHYQNYEESLLLSHLISADLVREDISESLQQLKAYCSRLVPQAELAAERCLQLTSGFAFPSLIRALATYLENFMDNLAQVARHVEQQVASVQDDWSIFSTCLFLMQTSGEILIAIDSMELSLSTTLAGVAAKIKWEGTMTSFTICPTSILTSLQEEALKLMIENVVSNDQPLLVDILSKAQVQCRKSVDVALNSIMAPISTMLSIVAGLPSWKASTSASSLSASFSPQEYITQIGQYLMTLPQHLEPLLVNHSPALNRALQETDTSSRPDAEVVSESEISAADFLISSVTRATCHLYTDVILRIPQIVLPMITQLTTDIDYICNIFEDLGVVSCDPLDKLNVLLKAPAHEYWNVVPGNNPRLVAAVRQMRNIPANS